MDKIEFTNNPEVIFKPDFNADMLAFNGIGIGQRLTGLPTETITEFYDIEAKNNKADIEDGWAMTKNGIQYTLEKGIVKQIGVKKNGIGNLSGFHKNDVEKRIGKPDKISNDAIVWVWDGTVSAIIYHYPERKTKIHFSTDNGKVCGLEIG